MMTRTLPSALVFAALLLAACGGDHAVTPTQFSTIASPALAVTPSPLSARPESLGTCPVASAFTVPFNLSVTSNVALSVTNVTMRFTDTLGVTQPQVTLPAPVPITQFGSALAEAKAQDFALSLPIACGIGRNGTLIIIVETQDHTGRAFSTQTTALVH